MNKGWFHFWRRLKDDPLWEPKRPRTKFEAWVDLCSRAKGSPGRDMVGHSYIPLDRGQLVFTYQGLSRDWGWSRTKIRHFIGSLEHEGRARIEPKEKYSFWFKNKLFIPIVFFGQLTLITKYAIKAKKTRKFLKAFPIILLANFSFAKGIWEELEKKPQNQE